MNYSELTPMDRMKAIAHAVDKTNEKIDNITRFDNEELDYTITLHAVAIFPKYGERMYGIDTILKVAILLGMTTNFGIKDDKGRKCACLTISPYKED